MVQSTQALVKLSRLTKSFAGTAAVAEVDLAIDTGELFCLLGSSGCGKTTLLRLIAGFITPDSGEIYIDGEDMRLVPPYRRPVNYMFQSYALFPHLSVYNNIAFGLQRAGWPRNEIRDRVNQLLQMLSLGRLANRKPQQLSGGECQRVALARSLARKPKILLLDEPLAALDKRLREQMQFELVQLQRQFATTFIVVTHDQHEAMTMANKIAVMADGKIIQLGSPREVYQAPANLAVAKFFGSVNLLAGKITAITSRHLKIVTDCCPHPLLAPTRDDCQVGQSIWLAIRPEQIRLEQIAQVQTRQQVSQQPTVESSDQVNGARAEINRCQGEIIDLAFRGENSVARVKVGNNQIITLSIANHEENSGIAWPSTLSNYQACISWQVKATKTLLH